jgi:diguanylate cyclase (GGDEF)-like protein
LFDAQGVILSRYPYLEQAIGTASAPSSMIKDPSASGSLEYVSMVDGVKRIAGYQRNHIFPVIVLSAVGYDEALARWNREFFLRAIGVSLLVIMIGYLGWGFAGELKRREVAEAELAILANTDGLTGLANRRTFDKALDIEWLRATREGTPMSLLLIDVDQFKAYNDIYGHQAGDECLRTVAAVLAQAVNRPGDLVARYGGEEIAILLPNTDWAGAANIAETIRAQIEALALRHDANAPSNVLTISIGSATRTPAFEHSRNAAQELVTLADRALYRAKLEGRNRIAMAEAA